MSTDTLVRVDGAATVVAAMVVAVVGVGGGGGVGGRDHDKMAPPIPFLLDSCVLGILGVSRKWIFWLHALLHVIYPCTRSISYSLLVGSSTPNRGSTDPDLIFDTCDTCWIQLGYQCTKNDGLTFFGRWRVQQVLE